MCTGERFCCPECTGERFCCPECNREKFCCPECTGETFRCLECTGERFCCLECTGERFCCLECTGERFCCPECTGERLCCPGCIGERFCCLATATPPPPPRDRVLLNVYAVLERRPPFEGVLVKDSATCLFIATVASLESKQARTDITGTLVQSSKSCVVSNTSSRRGTLTNASFSWQFSLSCVQLGVSHKSSRGAAAGLS